MGRPIKWRRIGFIPQTSYFIPSKKHLKGHEENILKLEELEAIRLKDFEGLAQKRCAQNMKVSRPTFQRILNSARIKLADSLINGKGIKIEGGNFTTNICLLKCMNCNKQWDESFENFDNVKTAEYICPNCGSKEVLCVNDDKMNFCKRTCIRNQRRKNKNRTNNE